MTHLTDEQLSAMLDGEMSGPNREAVASHLGECPECRERFTALGALDRSLEPALTHDPGDAYFERFAERVAERIAIEAAAKAVEPSADEHAGASVPDVASRRRSGSGAGGLMGLLDMLRTPRGLAWAGVAAVVVVGAGVVLMTTRDTPIPSLRKPELERRANQVAKPDDARGPSASDHISTDEAVPTPVGALADRNAEETESGDKVKEGVAPSVPVAPGRAIEVRRDTRGEEIPVQRQPSGFAEAPPANEKNMPDVANANRIPKPVATPMKTETQSDERSIGKRALTAARKPAANEPAAKSLTPGATGAAPAPTLDGTREAKDVGSIAGQADVEASRVCGEVRDTAGRPMVGAQVVLTDLGRATATDERGHYCIEAPAGRHELSVMAVGFETLRRTVEIDAESAEQAFALKAVSVVDDLSLTSNLFRGGRHGADTKMEWPENARSLVARAKQRSGRAASVRSASQFEQAAAEWERVLASAGEGQPALEARYRVAEAHYRAWELEPTPQRERAALESLTAFLTRAPQGAARDSAARWADRVKR